MNIVNNKSGNIGIFAKSIYNKHIKTKRHINKEKIFNKYNE